MNVGYVVVVALLKVPVTALEMLMTVMVYVMVLLHKIRVMYAILTLTMIAQWIAPVILMVMQRLMNAMYVFVVLKLLKMDILVLPLILVFRLVILIGIMMVLNPY